MKKLIFTKLFCFIALLSYSQTINCADSLPEIAQYDSMVVCEGDSLVLDAGDNFDSYSWSNGESTQTISVDTLGTFYVEVTLDTCTHQSDTIEILFSNPEPTLVNNGNTFIEGTGGWASYQWYLNGQPIIGAMNQTYCPEQFGNYNVEVTDTNGCTGMSNVYEFGSTLPCNTGISEDNFTKRFEVYPNPTSKTITLELELYENSDLRISLFNSTGQLVQSSVQLAHALKVRWHFNLGKLPDGLFFIAIENKDERLMKPVIKGAE